MKLVHEYGAGPSNDDTAAAAENEEQLAMSKVDGGADANLAITLRRCFGFSGFRPGQREVIKAILEGRDAAVFWTTASGKSLCFQVKSILGWLREC